MAGGRPTSFTPELGDFICAEISTSHKSLRTICKPDNMPCVQTVLNWLRTNDDFLAQYTRAKEEQADMLVEETLEIADDSTNDTIEGQYGPMENKEWVNRSKLRVDTRKWIASKLKPKKYGEKIEHSGEVKGTQEIIIKGSKFADKD